MLRSTVRLCFAIVAILGMVFLPARCCTTFMVEDGRVVLMGDSEDAGPRHPLAADPGAAYAFFLPGSEEAYGRMHIGWLWQGERRSFQAGMNEKGLAYGLTSVPAVAMTPHPEKRYQRSEGNLFDRLMRMAADVNEAMELLRATGFDELAFQIQLVDSGGDSVVVGPGLDGELAFTRKAEAGGFQAAATFNLAHPSEAIGKDSFDRFEAARSRLTRGLVGTQDPLVFSRDALEDVHREGAYALGGTYTVYSTLYDLTALTVTHYPVAAFDSPIRLDLRSELAGGEHTLALRDLGDDSALAASLRRYRIKQGLGIGLAAASVLVAVGMASSVLWALLFG